MPVIRTCTNCQQKNRVSAKHLSGTGRCGACKAPLAPVAEPLAVDGELSARYQIRSIPNFMVFSKGRIVFQQPGLVGHEQMEQWLRSAST